MNKEEFIESLLTEWSGKTISSNEHFMLELRRTLETAIGYGCGIDIMKPTLYETIVHSPQWQAWVQYNEDNMENEEVRCFDVHESTETGWLSDNHLQEFLLFCEEVYNK